MEKKHYYDFFTAILVHYNEIGLKAPQYRGKLESLLIDHIKKICTREEINIRNILNLQDRIIIFPDPLKITKTIQVLRYIFGIQSISPVITISNNLDELHSSLIPFSEIFLKKKDKFSINFKSVKALKKRFREIEKDLGAEIVNFLIKTKKNVKFINGKTKKTISIEFRENEGYIYTDSIPTLWGGMPLEDQKAIFVEYLGINYDSIVSHLTSRRGMISIPIFLNFGKFRKNSEEAERQFKMDIFHLAKHYPEPLPFLMLNIDILLNELELDLKEKNNNILNINKNPCLLCNFARMTLFDKLIKLTSSHDLLNFENRFLSPKGLAINILNLNSEFYRVNQRFSYISLFPLVGIPVKMIAEMNQQILNSTSNIGEYSILKHEKQIFKIHDIYSKDVERQILRCPLESQCNLYRHYNEKEDDKKFEARLLYLKEEELNLFKSPKYEQIFKKIIQNFKIQTITGRILI